MATTASAAAVDVNAYLGAWPFRRLSHTTPDALLRKMDAVGIECAVVSRLENVFYKNVLAGNRDLHALVKDHRDRFIPAYTINPGYPGWEDDLRICVDELGLRYVRLHPNYHRYHPLAPDCVGLLERAQELGLVMLLALAMEDERLHHWLAMVQDVAPADVSEAVNAFPGVRFLLTTGTFRQLADVWQRVDDTRNLYVENSRVQGPVGDVDRLCRLMGADHVLFGSNLPLYHPESARLSIDHAALDDATKRLLLFDNARRLFEL
jgi:predicted TIM-barrel fold metal-dependent hydrolase